MAAFGDVLLDAKSPDELWAGTSAALVRAGPFAGACVARADADGALTLAAAAGIADTALAGLHLRLDDTPESPPARAWSTRRPSLEPDVRGASWLDEGHAAALGSMLAIPVHEDGEVSAVLCVAAAEPDAFDDAAQDLCRRIGRLLERWLDHHDQLPHLQHQALHDPLTDLPNRRMLDEHLNAALARARRRGTVVAVGMLDIDDFKPINDTCGHNAGDRLLRELGQRLRGELRGQDLLVRLGGDEFALIIDDLPAGRASAELATALERLHGAVETPFELGQGRRATVGMSLGVALYPFDGDEIDQLIRQADLAMYRAKGAKISRLEWWQLASASDELPERDTPLPADGLEAAALLTRARGLFAQVSERFMPALAADIAADARGRVLVTRPDGSALQSHATHLAEHFGTLLDADAAPEERHRRAEAVGRVHALAGMGADSVVRALGLYRSLLGEQLAASPLTARERYRLAQVAEARLQEELQLELRGHGAAIAEHYQISASPLPSPGTPWVDAVEAELAALARLPGIRATTLQRADAEGRLTVEAHAGEAGAQLVALTRDPELRPLADASQAERGGLVGRAWASGSIQSSSDYQYDERTGPWREPLASCGVRSLMAIPVPGANDRPVAILVLYGAWLGQFDAAWMQAFAQGLQQRWATLWRRRRDPIRAPALARPVAESYRERLFEGGLSMHLQPIVDMATGRVVAAEALARLRLRGGAILAPNVFLPLLGEVELARLFRLTLDQALAALVAWDAEVAATGHVPDDAGGGAPVGGGQVGTAPEPGIAVNLPPSTLLEPGCPRWIAEALARYGLAPHRLSLELIETEEIGQEARQAAIRALVGLGVQLSIDDLGSGFSSLQRLTELPFDIMKIDQALIGRMYEQPLQTLSLVRSLIRLGEDLGRQVVVEGTSDTGLVEVAAVLGARYAQGFGIARPMAADALPGWQASFRVGAGAGHVRTAPGALAWHWRARRQSVLVHPPSLTDCPLDGYFREAGEDAAEGARLHARLHADAEPGQASDRLLAWLIARVHSETAAG